MIHLMLAVLLQAGDSTMLAPRPDSAPRPLFAAVGAPRAGLVELPSLGPAADTTKPRKKAVAIEYSDWYEKRLTIHRYASWAMLPLFVGQYVTGSTLIKKGTDSPQWVKTTHPILATGVAALFATNTVTGAWNWWEGRADPAARGWRTTHSVLMLLADAGFTYVGTISGQAKQSGEARDRHRSAAIISGSLAVTSWVMMLKPFRQD
jgi:hypothetical protein